MRILVGVILFFASTTAQAQYWEQWYGGIYYDEATAMDSTSDGGYIIGGVTYNAKVRDCIMLLRWTLWVQYNGPKPMG